MRRPPKPSTLLRRLSPDTLSTLGWCAVPALALLLYGTMPQPSHPVFLPRHHFLHPPPSVLLVTAGAMALPIGWASRWPLPVLALLLAEAIPAQVFGIREWPLFLAADVLIFYASVTCARRSVAWAVAGVIAVWVLVVVAFTPGGDAFELLTGPSSNLAVITIGVWILGSWIRLRQDHAEALRAQAAGQAVQAERLRIAREMHDMVAHSIGAIAIQAGAASRAIQTQPAGAREALDTIERTSRETLTGLRRMLGVLREAGSGRSEPGPTPGLEDIDRLVATAADAGIRVVVRWQGRRRPLAPDIELSAFRVIQESVTNVIRHANAARCQVSIEYGEEDLSIEVVDDGRGHGTTRPGVGYGIAGMRERIGLLHGHFSSGPGPEGGFRVAARLPV